MKKVVYSARAEQQLWELQDYIAVKSGFLDVGESFISEIVDFCDSMGELPLLGTLHEDLRPGLRIVGFRRRVVIAYVARAKRIEILGVFYGGQDYESRLSTDGN
ncbi:type II toxin-antitoxin system RelE/ParE family toxin [Mobiluncus mulieris]|uniref:type II toxin-antitoxin system RelE/ParE family toxin n=1 Tax=Mobiluncus mulieris TaxID=2052 RepID=UPI0021E23953|nr:type II toxin-antitoxin system RelE/ParE family toxin [Mobiluncus mulieris]MCU9995929.1 type II toxin-antitoxin system RelE/ParE family toxin [Mobiluncus mulieris]